MPVGNDGVRRRFGLATAAVAAALSSGAAAQDLTAAIEARIELADIDRHPIERPLAGAPFRIGLTLSDKVSRTASAGLHLSAFLKPQGARPAECRELARLYRATRRTARGDVDLNGLLLASLGEDGRLAIADPRLDLATSNLTRVVAFPEPPAAVDGDRATMSVVASLTGRGELVRVMLPGGDLRPFATGLAAPREFVVGADGRVVVHESGLGQARTIDRAGATVSVVRVGVGSRFSVSGPAVVLTAADGTAAAIDRADGRELGRAGFGPGVTEVAYSAAANALVAAAPGRPALIRRFLDEPDAAQEIAIATPAATLATTAARRSGSDKGLLFALDEGGRALSIVDMGSEELVQAAAFDDPVIAIAVTDSAAFLQFAGRAAVGVVLLDSVLKGRPIAVRRVDLGRTPDGAPSTAAAIMRPLDGGAGVMVAGPDPRGVYFVMQEAGHANAPQTAVRLRSDTPRTVVPIDRSFNEVAPGRYEAVATAPYGGRWTFVVAAGAGVFVQCAEIEIDGAGRTSAVEPPRLVLDRSRSQVRLGAPSTLVFAVVGGEARPTRAFAADLMGPWRASAAVTPRPDGAFAAEFLFPAAGQYPVVIAPDGADVSPLVIEVMP